MDIEELKNKIISTFKPFDPEKIILFGSLARGDWDEVSDIDLMVIYHTDKAVLDRMKELYLCWNIPKAVDILAYTPGEIEEMMNESSFVADARNEGEVLYERS
jgi:predicted nucleotidyltransferase